MANPTSVKTTAPAVILAGTSQGSVALNHLYEYTISHDSEDDSGVPQTSTIYFAFAEDVTATPAEGENKLKLLNGSEIRISKVSTLNFKVASGASPVTFSIIRGPEAPRG